MKRFSMLFALLASVPAFAAAAEVQGILIDQNSSWKLETRVTPSGHLEGGLLSLYVYKRSEALEPEAQKSGYGVATYESKFLKFDHAGSEKAKALLKSSKKEDDLRVIVTGEVMGDTIKVSSIKFE